MRWAGDRDLIAGAKYLQSRPDVDPERIGGFGSSVGGEILLVAAAESTAFRAVVSEGAGFPLGDAELPGLEGVLYAPANLVMRAAATVFANHSPPPRIVDRIGEIAPRAVFLIYTEPGMGGEDVRQPKYFAAAREPKSIWKVPGAEHTGGIEARPAEYERRVIEFFDRALLPPRERGSMTTVAHPPSHPLPRDRSWPLPATARRVLMLVPPLALAVLEFFHPAPDVNAQAVMDVATWFAVFHAIQLVLIGLVGLSVFLLADSFGRATAWTTRLGIGAFLVFYSAYDGIAGISTGLAMRNARDLPGRPARGRVGHRQGLARLRSLRLRAQHRRHARLGRRSRRVGSGRPTAGRTAQPVDRHRPRCVLPPRRPPLPRRHARVRFALPGRTARTERTTGQVGPGGMSVPRRPCVDTACHLVLYARKGCV